VTIDGMLDAVNVNQGVDAWSYPGPNGLRYVDARIGSVGCEEYGYDAARGRPLA
jgi:hypothetical protein